MMEVNGTASQIADVMITLNGLLQSVLHFLLRANSERLAIRPRQTPWTKKRKIRLFGPNDLNIHDFISTPLLLDRESAGQTNYYEDSMRKDNVESVPSFPQQQFASLRSPGTPQTMTLNQPRSSMAKKTLSRTHYSIFPSERTQRVPIESWITEFSTESDDVQPPPPIFTKRHGRNDSTQTSETVEIALRLSHAIPEEMSPTTPTSITRPITARIVAEPALLSPDRYVPPAKKEAAQENPEFEKPHVLDPPIRTAGVGLKPGLKRGKSIRDSLASLPVLWNKQVNKSLPPVPRDSSIAGPVTPSFLNSSNSQAMPTTKPAPDWRKPSPLRPSPSNNSSDSSWPLPIQQQTPPAEGWI
jgi:hypothetical protein